MCRRITKSGVYSLSAWTVAFSPSDMLDNDSPTWVVLACDDVQCEDAAEAREPMYKLAYIVYDPAHDKVFSLRRCI